MAQGYPIWSGAFWNLNERERREKKIEDEALMRELAKLAAQAGYQKEIADMGDRAAMDRAKVGESGAKDRQMAELALREKLAQDAIQARVDEQGRDFLSRLGAIKTEYNARGDLAEKDWQREAEHRAILAEVARRNSLAQGTGAAAQFADKVGDLDPALLEGLTGVKPRAAAGLAAGPTKPGRIKLGGGTSPKPGETPRTPDNAAPEVPVKVGPKPLTAEASRELTGPSLTDVFREASPYAFNGKDGTRVVEEYIRGLKGNQSYIPPEWGELRLDKLSQELGYDQRRPAIKK